MDKTRLDLTILGTSDVDRAELDRFGVQLYQRLRELRVDLIEHETSGQVPAGTKSDLITLTSLAVTLLTPLLPKLVDVIRDILKEWKGQGVQLRIGDMSVTLPSNASSAEVGRIAALLTAAAEQSVSQNESKARVTDRK